VVEGVQILQYFEAIKVIKEYDSYLDSSLSVDYWSDEGISIAAEKLTRFTDNDWLQLEQIVESRDKEWLVRCAEVLGEIETTVAIDILMKLIKNNSHIVQIAALDSISALLDIVDVGNNRIVELRNELDKFKTTSDIATRMLDSLKIKVQPVIV
jgi:hypothetical protein